MIGFDTLSRTVIGGLLGLVCLTVLTPAPTAAQSRLTGQVVDAESGRPLSSVNVFLDGTTIGTATDEQGQFALSGVEAGTYTVVASRVGYQSKAKEVRLQDTTRTLTFELAARSISLKGVTVEGSRDQWLNRLDRFRKGFFGGVRQSQLCELINPEVLSFQTTEQGLVAHAKRPLRVRNEALGYEVTFHGSRYVIGDDARRRRGHFEFDPLEAESKAQRQEWARARRRVYQGSFRHFVHALQEGALKAEGFEVYWTSLAPATRDHKLGAGTPDGGVTPVSEAESLTESAMRPDRMILKVPRGEFLEVRFVLEGEAEEFARRYRGGTPRSMQVSWVDVLDGTRVAIDTKSGDFVRRDWMGFGVYSLYGYWGWAETAATALPSNYRPSDRRNTP